jgi:hydrogenase maturation protein HypF
VGLGEDGTLWGGEAFLGDAGDWRRVCSLRPFRPPGADRAGREPWRSAAGLIWETDDEWRETDAGILLAKQAWESDLNCPATSAAGRLFDAAAALICGVDKVSFEAQGPMMLEALAQNPVATVSLPLTEYDGVLRSDWAPLLPMLRDIDRGPADRAENFHSNMAQVIVDQANAVRERHDVDRIGLVGGVFQNRLLTEQATAMLEAAGFEVYVNQTLPCNDAALSFGQAAEWAAGNNQESD